MFCDACGLKLSSEAKFCNACGDVVADALEATTDPAITLPEQPVKRETGPGSESRRDGQPVAVKNSLEARTPAQLLKHRELQMGRLTEVLFIAVTWFGYTPRGEAVTLAKMQLLVALLVPAVLSSIIWLWLAHRTGRLHEPSFWRGVGKQAGILLAFAFVRAYMRW